MKGIFHEPAIRDALKELSRIDRELLKSADARPEVNPFGCDYFGVCPKCHDCDSIVNRGRHHWGVCRRHLVAWHIGENLFSSWHDQTEAEFVAVSLLLAACRVVTPAHANEPVREPVLVPDDEVPF